MTSHTATITLDGPVDITHPDPDHEDCDFEDYLARDWSDPEYLANSALLGPREFIWVVTPQQSYWNSTPLAT